MTQTCAAIAPLLSKLSQQVGGMTCSSCTLAVEQALSIPGVLSVTVSLMQAEAKVEYDAGLVTQASTELRWASAHFCQFTSI